ncbi:hypothetical protein [Actinoplanes sp. NPDC049316]|uniref:hypothetical protein n=1 Tax=Actinoplanes sp. NPDC049316 TaxID=3154727 RepID=UPI003426C811
MKYKDLTDAQQQLVARIQDATDCGFTDELFAELRATDAPAQDKAAVAEFLGGSSAAREFLEG